MIQKIEIDSLRCLCCRNDDANALAYILFPVNVDNAWIEQTAVQFGVSVVAITGMDWDNDLTPWPSPGAPQGSPDFGGNAAAFLQTLQNDVVPAAEQELALDATPRRLLIGPSLAGLFALWQWMQCDTFDSIASISGSFWYPGFMDWLKVQSIAPRTGRAYFSLGQKEAATTVDAFKPIADNTQAIVDLLKSVSIATSFEWTPGGHYANPAERLGKALTALV